MTPIHTLLGSLALTLATAVPLVAQDSPQPSGGDGPIEVTPPEVDFGDLYAGEEAAAEVTFTNRSDTPWAVRQVKPSCGCTVANVFAPNGDRVPDTSRGDLPIATVGPGESLKVEVGFNTANQQGQVEKKLYVYGLNPADPTVELKLKARVNRVIMVTPNYLQLGTLDKRSTIEREVVVEARDIGDWKISGFESNYAGVPLPKFISLKTVSQDGDSRRVKITVHGPREVGPFNAQIKVLIDHPRVSEATFTLIGSVQPDISFQSGHKTFPEALVFDQMAADATATRTLMIENRDPTVPYILEAVEVAGAKSEYFKASIREIQKGVRYQVALTADGAIGMPFFRGNLRLRARHPEIPEKDIQFHGWVRQEGN